MEELALLLFPFAVIGSAVRLLAAVSPDSFYLSCLCRLLILMINRTVSVLFWNVHGLGQTDKCAEIKRVLTSRLPSIVCLQESKLEEIPHFKKLSLLPAPLQSLVFLPSIGASGGIVTA